MNHRFWKNGVFAALITACLLFGGVGRANALDRDRDEKCEKRIHKAEDALRDAERRHGEHSRQAEQRRRQLEEAREKCHHDRDHDRDRH